MKKIFEWLSKIDRWKHLVGGVCIGFGANDWYCAGYTGLVTACALEYRDKVMGYKFDWGRFLLTAAGAVVGHIVRVVL